MVKKKATIMDWFPNYNSNCNNIKIGLVNRKKNRILTNYKEVCDNIKKSFNIEVDITYFEDKSFDYQIKFFTPLNI